MSLKLFIHLSKGDSKQLSQVCLNNPTIEQANTDLEKEMKG